MPVVVARLQNFAAFEIFVAHQKEMPTLTIVNVIELIKADPRMEKMDLVLEPVAFYLWRNGQKRNCTPLGHQEVVFWKPPANTLTRADMVLCLACPAIATVDAGVLCELTGMLAGIEQLPAKGATLGGAAMLALSNTSIIESDVDHASDLDSMEKKRDENGVSTHSQALVQPISQLGANRCVLYAVLLHSARGSSSRHLRERREGRNALVPEGRCAVRVAVLPLGRVGELPEDRSAAAAKAPAADQPGAEEGQCKAAAPSPGCEVAGGHRPTSTR